MFEQDELLYALACIEAARSPDSNTSRLKIRVMTKILDALEQTEADKKQKKN